MKDYNELDEVETGQLKYETPLKRLDPDLGENWISVGRAIYDASMGDEYGLAVFYQWSRRGKKHRGLQEIQTAWDSFRTGERDPYPTGTLIFMATEAVGMDPDLYMEIEHQIELLEYRFNRK